MQRGDLLDVQLQPRDVLVEIHRKRIYGRWWWWIRSRWCPGVAFDEDLLLRQVDHRERVVVSTAGDLVDLDRAAAVGEHVLVGERLERRRLLRLRQLVGVERVRRGPCLLVV